MCVCLFLSLRTIRNSSPPWSKCQSGVFFCVTKREELPPAALEPLRGRRPFA